jgi:hypothetical protein
MFPRSPLSSTVYLKKKTAYFVSFCILRVLCHNLSGLDLQFAVVIIFSVFSNFHVTMAAVMSSLKGSLLL